MSIIETDSSIMTAPPLSVDAVNESVSNDIIDDIEPTVNGKSMQESENYSGDEEFFYR